VNMPFSHPLYQGTTGHMFGEVSAQIVAQADAILVVGTYIFPEVFPLLEAPFAPGCKIIHIDLNAYEIAKNFPADQALLGDPRVGLAGLAAALDAMAPLEQRKQAAEALKQARTKKEAGHQAAVEADQAAQARGGGRMALFAETLASKLPAGSIVFDEALTNSPAVTRYLNFDQPGTFFQTRGGSLGVGIPGALGLKLAHPDHTVVGFTGDGGSMYTIQALWTAARHQIDAKFVICNNGAYKLLKLNIDQYWDVNQITPRGYPHSFDLTNPVIDFAAVARGMHVAAERVERNEDVAAAIDRMLTHQGPYLIDLILPED
jgi:benzoylformate decarboxylase